MERCRATTGLSWKRSRPRRVTDFRFRTCRPGRATTTSPPGDAFIFRCVRDVSEREHAFFVYAVDNRASPIRRPRASSSARTTASAEPIIDIARATERSTRWEMGGVSLLDRVTSPTPTPSAFRATPSRPAQAGTLQWHGEPAIPGSHVLGFTGSTVDVQRHRLLGTRSFSTAARHHVPWLPGVKALHASRGEASGWRSPDDLDYSDELRAGLWYAGPDVNSPAAGWSSWDGNGNITTTGRAALVVVRRHPGNAARSPTPPRSCLRPARGAPDVLRIYKGPHLGTPRGEPST